MEQFTKKQAIAIAESGEWKDWTDDEIVRIGLFQDKLCVPFRELHRAIKSVLGRSVFSHEFAYKDRIIDEYQRERPAPTFEEIVNLIPEEKRMIVSV